MEPATGEDLSAEELNDSLLNEAETNKVLIDTYFEEDDKGNDNDDEKNNDELYDRHRYEDDNEDMGREHENDNVVHGNSFGITNSHENGMTMATEMKHVDPGLPPQETDKVLDNRNLSEAEIEAQEQKLKLKSALIDYWSGQRAKIDKLTYYCDEIFHIEMPLARIKKIMRLTPGMHMIGSRTPQLISKAVELFIGEITTRAWHETDSAKRRTIRNSNVVKALPKTDVFDFLIDIVPRDEGDRVDLHLEEGANDGMGGLGFLLNKANGSLLPKEFDVGSDFDMELKLKETDDAEKFDLNQLDDAEELNLPDIEDKNDKDETDPRNQTYSEAGSDTGISVKEESPTKSEAKLEVSADTKNISKMPDLKSAMIQLTNLGLKLDQEGLEKLIEYSKKTLNEMPPEWVPTMLLIMKTALTQKKDAGDNSKGGNERSAQLESLLSTINEKIKPKGVDAKAESAPIQKRKIYHSSQSPKAKRKRSLEEDFMYGNDTAVDNFLDTQDTPMQESVSDTSMNKPL